MRESCCLLFFSLTGVLESVGRIYLVPTTALRQNKQDFPKIAVFALQRFFPTPFH